MDAIEIVEVSPRDGLQNEPDMVAAGNKIALIERMVDLGVRRLEVASFVNPRRVPQMADSEAVIARLPDEANAVWIGLCLNTRGVERAIASEKIVEAGCVIVATDSFGIANQGQTVPEGIAANRAMLALAKGAGLRAQVTISAAFGCPFEGPVPPSRVLDIAEAMAEAGAEEVAFADTIGVGVPSQVGEMFERAFERLGKGFPLRVHLHDTRGLAPANAWAAYQAGCRVFDSSLGGLGGCPFAPGAKGNVATEELLYMFERSGVDTGLNFDKVLAANQWFAGVIGRALPSRVGQAGDFIARNETREAA